MDDIYLEKFIVERERFGSKKGMYTCTARYSTEEMNFSINLPQDVGEALLKVSRDHIGKASERALEKLTMMARETSTE